MNYFLILCLLALAAIIGAWYTERYFTGKYIQLKERSYYLESNLSFLQSLFRKAKTPNKQFKDSILSNNHYEQISTRIKNRLHIDDIIFWPLNVYETIEGTNALVIPDHTFVTSYVKQNHTAILAELIMNPIITKTINQQKSDKQYILYISQAKAPLSNSPHATQLTICLQIQDPSLDKAQKALTKDDLVVLGIALEAIYIALYGSKPMVDLTDI
jgi:hypothetical protein